MTDHKEAPEKILLPSSARGAIGSGMWYSAKVRPALIEDEYIEYILADSPEIVRLRRIAELAANVFEEEGRLGQKPDVTEQVIQNIERYEKEMKQLLIAADILYRPAKVAL